MSSPVISCIIPVYMAEKFLVQCLNSVINQSFQDFEVILVDDGSTDNSGYICDEYASKDERVKVIHKKNGGVSSARNAGLAIARGEWICFIDSDDWVDDNYLSSLYQAVCIHNCDCSMCGITVESETSIGVRNCITEQTPVVAMNHDDFLSVFRWLRQDPQYATQLHAPVNKLMKKDLLQGISFDCSMRVGEDYCFVVDMLGQVRSFVCIPQNTYHYRTNLQSATHIFRKSDLTDRCAVIRKTLQFDNLQGNFLSRKYVRSLEKECFILCLLTEMVNQVEGGNIDFAGYNEFRKKLTWQLFFTDILKIKYTIVIVLLFFRVYRLGLDKIARLYLGGKHV